jgi:hypothetical protein
MMAKAKPEYEVLDEFKALAKLIVDKHPNVFYGIEVDAVQCVAITNKERPDTKAELWQVVPVKMPIRLDCQYGWYVVLFQEDWEEASDKQKKLIVASALCAIPAGEDAEGKANRPDFNDYAVMLRTFGVDYLDNSEVPDLLEDDINWKN